MNEITKYMVEIVPIIIIFTLNSGALIVGWIEIDTMLIALILLFIWLELKVIEIKVK